MSAINTISIIKFGNNLFDYFLNKFPKGSFFYLSIDESIFDSCLKGIKKDSLLDSLSAIKLDWDIELYHPNKLESQFIALAIASYQVLNVCDVKVSFDLNLDTITKKLCHVYGITSAKLNENFKKKQRTLWDSVFSLFKNCNRILYLPENSSNYVTYPISQLYFLNQAYKNILANILKNKLFLDDNRIYIDENEFYNYLEQLKSYPSIFKEKYLTDFKTSTISTQNFILLLQSAITIFYKKWDGSYLKSRFVSREKNVDTTDELITLEPDADYRITVWKNNIEKFFNNEEGLISYLESLILKYKQVFFYETESGDFENSFELNKKDKSFYVLSLNDSLESKFELINCIFGNQTTLFLYQISDSANIDRSIFFEKDTFQKNFIGGIKIGYNTWLENCEPVFFSDFKQYDAKGPGIHKIQYGNQLFQITIVENKISKREFDYKGIRITKGFHMDGLKCSILDCAKLENDYYNGIIKKKFRLFCDKNLVYDLLGGVVRWH